MRPFDCSPSCTHHSAAMCESVVIRGSDVVRGSGEVVGSGVLRDSVEVRASDGMPNSAENWGDIGQSPSPGQRPIDACHTRFREARSSPGTPGNRWIRVVARPARYLQSRLLNVMTTVAQARLRTCVRCVTLLQSAFNRTCSTPTRHSTSAGHSTATQTSSSGAGAALRTRARNCSSTSVDTSSTAKDVAHMLPSSSCAGPSNPIVT